jgi:2-aminoadipate transaminase
MVKPVSSAIRDLLVVAERPGLITMAGGLPAPESFPIAAVAAATADVLDADGPAALQYSTTQGNEGLRRWFAARLEGDEVTADDVVVTAGSQQALDLIARALLGPGDVVAMADPGYVGAIQAFHLTGAELLGVPADEGGLDVDALADLLSRGARPKLVYVVANFSNPGGATLPTDRRRTLAALADRYGFLIIDDDPYGELRWGGRPATPLRDLSERVLTLGTMSKVLAPGLRVGFAHGPAPVIADVVLLKQAADLHTSTLAQRVALRVVSDERAWAAHLGDIRSLYCERARALDAALRRHLGERISCAAPEGGMFVWANVAGVDTAASLDRAIEHGVAYVPGGAFAISPGGHVDALRLSYATATPEALDEGARRLGVALLG